MRKLGITPQLNHTTSNLSVINMFSDKGISVKGSPREVAEISDVVITMLPSPSHVSCTFYYMFNFYNPMKPWLFIDSSTIDPQTTRKISSAVSNCALIDKRGVAAAEAGTLTFIFIFYAGIYLKLNGLYMANKVGGADKAYKAAKHLFSSMGKNAIYCGGAGTGSSNMIYMIIYNLYGFKLESRGEQKNNLSSSSIPLTCKHGSAVDDEAAGVVTSLKAIARDDYSKVKGLEKRGYVRLVGRMPATKDKGDSTSNSQTIHQLQSVINVMMNITHEHIPNANLATVLSDMNIQSISHILMLDDDEDEDDEMTMT
ncbi:hypothetical protein R6Q57_009077 [Mikania cordata]